MKRLTSVTLAIAFLAFFGGSLFAGDYHTGDTLICYDCHVAHYSQTHGYNSDGTGFFVALGTEGPYHYLLRNEINALCLTCHDNQAFAPDVFEANGGNSNVRQAGGLNELGGNGFYPPPTGHTLYTEDTAPGGTWSAGTDGLVCTNCHQQHGYHPSGESAYRNLQYSPGGAYAYPGLLVDYAIGTNDGSKAVFERSAASYDIDDMDFNEPDQTASTYAEWCKGCHTNFHGDKGGAEMGGATGEEWLRHPAADANIGALTGGHSSKTQFASPDTTKLNYVKVMTATEDWTPIDPSLVTDHTPSCFTCHKAHGNMNPFGLIMMDGYNAGGITEEGTALGVYKDLCKQCHVQG